MLKILHYVFSAVTLFFAFYGLITKNFEFYHLMLFFLGLAMLVSGLREFQKGRKVIGWLMVAVFSFALFTAIQWYLINI